MRKQLLLSTLVCMLVIMASCNEDEKGDLLKVTDYQFTFSDYTTLEPGSFPYINLYFTPLYPAKDYLPEWLYSRYYTVAEGSTAMVTYDYRDYDIPEILNDLSKVIQPLTSEDYQYCWGDIYATFFTPSKSPENEIPVILNATVDAEDGDFIVVQYDYSDEEADIHYDQETVYFFDDFNELPGNDWDQFTYNRWYNEDLSGVGFKWRTRVASATNRIATGYSRNRTGSASWLINEDGIDLRNTKSPTLSFTYGFGYHDPTSPTESFDCMQVLVTDRFDGADPSKSEWKDVSDEVGIRDVPSSTGYPGTYTLTLDLTSYVDKKFHVGFYYYLPTRAAAYSLAPLYYVDNVKVYEVRDVAEVSGVENRYGLFRYQNGAWRNTDNSFYILQDTDYIELNLPTLSAIQASQQLPALLNQKFQNATVGETKIIVYKINETTTGASDFEYTASGWKEAGREIESKTDKYIFNEDSKWTFDSVAD